MIGVIYKREILEPPEIGEVPDRLWAHAADSGRGYDHQYAGLRAGAYRIIEPRSATWSEINSKFRSFRPPEVLSVLVQGKDRSLGNTAVR